MAIDAPAIVRKVVKMRTLHRKLRRLTLPGLLLLLCTTPVMAAADSTYKAIDLSVAGHLIDGVQMYGSLNAKGDVFVNMYPGSSWHSYLDSNGQFVEIKLPEHTWSVEAALLNANGLVAGVAHLLSSGWHPFVYDGGKVTDLISAGKFGSDSSGKSHGSVIGISDTGLVLGQVSVYDAAHKYLGEHSFVYANGQITDLAALPTGAFWPVAINAQGKIIGQRNGHAVIYENGTFTDMPSLADATVIGSTGVIAGHSADERNVVIYDNGTVVDISALHDFGTDASGFGNRTEISFINAAGQAVGTAYGYDANGQSTGLHAFFYSNGTVVDLNELGQFPAGPNEHNYIGPVAFNDRGRALLSASLWEPNGQVYGYGAYLYSDGKLIDLHALGNFGTGPTGKYWCHPLRLNASGQALVEADTYDSGHNYLGTHTFLFSGSVFTDLNALAGGHEGWDLHTALGINDAGQILVEGIIDGGVWRHAFLLSPSVSVTVTASPSAGGTVLGDGVYGVNEPVTVTATAKAGYAFLNWTDGGTVVSELPQYKFVAAVNRVLVANFVALCTITTSVSPPGSGRVTGGGVYQAGQPVIVTATANAGYTFLNWTAGGTVVSALRQYKFVAEESRNLVANFSSILRVATIVSPPEGGSVTGGGEYKVGDNVNLWAFSAPGYNFVNWTENGLVVSTTASYTFVFEGSRTLVANFVKTIATYVTMGNFTGQTGKSLTLTATLYDKAVNTVLSGKNLRFGIDGVNLSGDIPTDASGKAKFTFVVPDDYPLGTHSVSVAFSGDGVYGWSSKVSTLTVNKGSAKLTVPTVYGSAGSPVTLIGKITNAAGVPLPGVTLAFAVGGVSAGSALTDATGTAKLIYAIPSGTAIGSYPTTVTFAGDASHLGATKNGWLQVK